jgi:ATP-dependent Clp endopeptidase proteolytic subunit ClpP
MNVGHIYIDDEIDGYMAQSVKEQIEANRGVDKLVVHISSPGGSVNLGYNIYHRLKNLPIQKECVIEGNCMSIATLISLACDRIIALNPSRYMIHLPSMGLEGTRSDLENGAKELKQIEDEIVAVYQKKTNLPAEQLMAMMSKETYMSADEARGFGFVDEVKEELKAVAKGKMRNKNIWDSLGERIAQAFKQYVASNMEIQSDKGVITIDGEDGAFEGKPVTIEGQPAPDGEYKLENGKIITVAGGVVTAVVDAPAPEPAPESPEDKLKKMEEQMSALKAENEQLKAAQATAAQATQQLASAEQKVAAMEASAKEQREAFMKLKDDFEDLRKKTVGDDAPPAGPASHSKEPKASGANGDYWAEETKLFLKEHLPHLVKN